MDFSMNFFLLQYTYNMFSLTISLLNSNIVSIVSKCSRASSSSLLKNGENLVTARVTEMLAHNGPLVVVSDGVTVRVLFGEEQ